MRIFKRTSFFYFSLQRFKFSQKLFSFLFLSFISSITFAQEAEDYTSIRPKLPVISIAPGVFHFKGDIGYTKMNEPMLGRSGVQVEVQFQTKSRFSVAAILLSGQVSGEEQSRNGALNFRSSIVAEGIIFRYDFINQRKPDQILVPYVTCGIEYMFFRAYSDLKDRNGISYHYWDDGSIRNLAQSDTGASGAIKLHRDYSYETDLRDANLDGLGKYRQGAWAFPLGAGFRFNISQAVSLHFSSVVHLVTSDLIDGVTEEGEGVRMGNSKNDKLIFSSVSFRYNLASERKKNSKNTYHPDKMEVRDVDFIALDNEDADKDGIPDIQDDSSATPASKEVDSKGKPIDKDNDGIPDYRDLELNSAVNAVVTVDGVTITEEMIELKFQKDSLAAIPALIEYIQSYDRLLERNPEYAKQEVLKLNQQKSSRSFVPEIYRRLDTDQNEYISPGEISIAIDEYMAGKSRYSVQEFYNLIDFFFLQK